MRNRLIVAALVVTIGAVLAIKVCHLSTEPELANAIARGDLAEIERLLAEGADVNSKLPQGNTPLHYAVMDKRKANQAVVKLLISHGVDVNAVNDAGTTPLHFAAGNGRADLVKLLLEAGADCKAKDNYGHTPMDAAEYPATDEADAQGKREVLVILRSYGRAR